MSAWGFAVDTHEVLTTECRDLAYRNTGSVKTIRASGSAGQGVSRTCIANSVDSFEFETAFAHAGIPTLGFRSGLDFVVAEVSHSSLSGMFAARTEVNTVKAIGWPDWNCSKTSRIWSDW